MLYYHRQKGSDVSYYPNSLCSPSIKELCYNGLTYIYSNDLNRSWQHITNSNRMQHCRKHQNHFNILQYSFVLTLSFYYICYHVRYWPVISYRTCQYEWDTSSDALIHYSSC